MSSHVGTNATFVLDALVHGLVLKALTDGFAIDAVANALNISKLEIMTMLTPQASLANLFLVPILKLEPLFSPTLVPTHLHNQIRQIPSSGPIPTAASFNQVEDPMDFEFEVVFWSALTFVTTIALLALWTKFKMLWNRNWEKIEVKLETEEPKDDLERWCLRRKWRRECEAKKEELEKLSMEVKQLEKVLA